MNLGRVLQGFRWANRIGIRELAKDLGTSPATLSRVERGENCDAETLAKILNWLLRRET